MAVEALRYFDIDPRRSQAVLLHSSEPRSVSALRETVATSGPEWTVVDTGPRTRLRQVLRASAVRRLAEHQAGLLFIGDLRNPHMNYLASAAPEGTVHVLDDGRGTIQAARARSSAATSRARSPQRRAQLRMLGLDCPPPERVTFFSIFELDTASQDHAVSNPLSVLRDRVSRKPTGDYSLLLGSPFVELGSMTVDHYVDTVLAAVRQIGGRVVFRPHRRERSEKLERMRSLGVEVDPGEGPVELSLLGAPELPQRVSSFFSTATFTLWRLLGSSIRVDSFELTADDFTDDFLSWNDGVPDLCRQSGGQIQIVALDR